MAPDGPDVETVARLLDRRSEDDHPALVFEEEQWTWRQVVAEARARAGLLTQYRVDGPVHLGVLLDNTPEYVFLLAGAALAGATVVGLNPTRRGEELARDVRSTDCVLVVTDTGHRDLLDGLDLGGADDRVLAADTHDYRASSTRAARVAAEAPLPEPTPDDLYLLVFTSGSTGTPKAVRMSQGRAARAALRMPFQPDDVLYSAMPLFHGNALSSSLFPWMASGARLALRRRFSASGFLPDVRRHGATFMNTVGRAVAHILATDPTVHDRDHRLKYVLGPETSATDKAEFTRRFGVPLFEGYGSSEGAIVLHPVGDDRPGALGRCPRAPRRRWSTRPPARSVPLRHSTTERTAHQSRRGHRRADRPVAALGLRGLLQEPRRPRRNGCATDGTGRATSPTGTPTASSTSPAGRVTGCASTARTSRRHRSSGSSDDFPACRGSLSTPSLTPAPATR